MGNFFSFKPQPYDKVILKIIEATGNQSSCNATVGYIDQIFGKDFGKTKSQNFNNQIWNDQLKIPESKYLAFQFGRPDDHWLTMFFNEPSKTWILWHSWQGVFTLKGWCCLDLVELSKKVKTNPLKQPATWLKEFCDIWICELKKTPHYDNQLNEIEKAYNEQFNINRTVKIMYWKQK